ncbi:predicted protein [Chaetomium globosum CBS 148.51]|uniref:Uncharacterized protein n=1 Tax=Chaetomium globosum (strain ATCC 6205 / CBS 148.51 / DSM 1962 / NBRC 6347 / NRRL 1970) TaxID=306901 RepID=Q2GPF2_CHAGB|nr:uncharacterized protein CHGG_10152 [Chaetomium globosum CBS 148.51]EAQ83748.1 predicted protein [Chaetomium globosum CBS 148.51]
MFGSSELAGLTGRGLVGGGGAGSGNRRGGPYQADAVTVFENELGLFVYSRTGKDGLAGGKPSTVGDQCRTMISVSEKPCLWALQEKG